MIIRKTEPADLFAIGEIYENAKRFMRESGNPTQWDDGKPNIDTAREDMENGVGYVAEENGGRVKHGEYNFATPSDAFDAAARRLKKLINENEKGLLK